MRSASIRTAALAFCLVGVWGAGVFADQQEEFSKLPRELAHVKIYDLATPLKTVSPIYPPAAKKQSVEADVWIKALLSKEGKVVEAAVVYCDQKGFGFEYSAQTAAMQWVFEPRTKDGLPITCWCYFRVPFRLSASSVPAEEVLPSPDEFIAVDAYPEMTEQIVPVFPKACLEAGVTGSVWVKVLVDKYGNVRDVMLARTSGTACGLDETALSAARDCKFTPAVLDNQPVACWVTFKVDFVTQ